MNASIYKTHFEHSAFVWDSIFDDCRPRRVPFYGVENRIAVEEAGTFDISIPLTTQVIVERFLDYGCSGDRERYRYRNLQIENFLSELNFETLCRGITPDVNKPLVLLDDRRVLEGTPTIVSGNHESSRRTLTACELYEELRQNVCLTLTYQYNAY